MKYTKGEWKQSHRIINEDGDYMTQVYTDKIIICDLHWAGDKVGNTTISLRPHNAKLIAAAPKLLESLITLQNRLEYLHQSGRVDVNESETLRDINIADKAIRKATE